MASPTLVAPPGHAGRGGGQIYHHQMVSRAALELHRRSRLLSRQSACRAVATVLERQHSSPFGGDPPHDRRALLLAAASLARRRRPPPPSPRRARRRRAGRAERARRAAAPPVPRQRRGQSPAQSESAPSSAATSATPTGSATSSPTNISPPSAPPPRPISPRCARSTVEAQPDRPHRLRRLPIAARGRARRI